MGSRADRPRRHLGVEDVVGIAHEHLDRLRDLLGGEAPVEERPHVVERAHPALGEGGVELGLEHGLEHGVGEDRPVARPLLGAVRDEAVDVLAVVVRLDLARTRSPATSRARA